MTDTPVVDPTETPVVDQKAVNGGENAVLAGKPQAEAITSKTATDSKTENPDDKKQSGGSETWPKDHIVENPPKIGGQDPNGCDVTTIFASTRQFFIYEADNQIRFILPENYDLARKLRQRIADLGGLRASTEDLRNHPSLGDSNEKVRAGREISWALTQAFEDEAKPPSEQPKEIMTRVDARLRSLVKSHYRKKYVIANLIAFVAIEVFLLLLASALGYAATLAALRNYALYAAFGGLGAFLSVVTGIRSVDVDINLKTWEHIFAGATRILIGVVGAVVVALALDSALIDPTFGNSQTETKLGVSGLDRKLALSFIFAFIGGFSESLVPNLLRRGEQAAGASDKGSASSDPIVKDMKP